MNRTTFIFFSFLMALAISAQAQLKVEADALAVQEGTVFSVDGLTMVPASDLSINNVDLEKHQSTIYWPNHNSIQRIHRFSKPITFKGLLSMEYRDSELNSNRPTSLALAHAPFTTINSDDFIINKASDVSQQERQISANYAEAIKFSDLTAVTPESNLPAYMELEIHNVITPNDDGINDTWIIKNIELYPNNSVQIFDRDGRVVFAKLGYDNSWNGMFNGAPLAEDTYYYVLHLDSNKGKDKLTGYISLIRETK